MVVLSEGLNAADIGSDLSRCHRCPVIRWGHGRHWQHLACQRVNAAAVHEALEGSLAGLLAVNAEYERGGGAGP